MKRQQLNALYLVIIAACYILATEAVTGTCNRWFGPAGAVHCIQVPGIYYGYQWATCRTNTYVKTTSKGRHKCADSTTDYCYYQCMLDVYGRGNGVVFSQCKCSPTGPPPTVKVPLPAWCYSPDGRSCSWYRDCLNKAYPKCEDDKDDYAIKFSEKFCQLYNESYKEFSPEGKKWVDAVRKCLQVKLVPLIDRFRVKTCKDLKSTAFKTHSPCYLNPDQTSLSYCRLSNEDKDTVFWTIKSSILKAFWPTLKGLLDVRKGCSENTKTQEVKAKIQEEVNKITSKNKTNPVNDVIREMNVRIKVWVQNSVSPIQFSMFIRDNDWDKASKRRKRSVPDDREIARSQFAGKIVDAIASEQMWKDKGVAWFAYAENDGNIMSIRLLVADRFKYERRDTSTSPLQQSANLTEILMQLGKDVLNGTLNLQLNGESVEITKLNGCLDLKCEEHAFNIKSLKFQENNGNGKPKEACDADNGPDGARQCVKLSGYMDYQWLTCRTNSYIKLKTNGKHYCTDQSRTYCRYQCMLDKYEESSGDVYSSCQCSGSQKVTYSFAYVVLLAAVSFLLVR
jgi:hypothetical protein